VKVTITLPDELAERVNRLPDRDEFVSRLVAHALARQPQEQQEPKPRQSKWAKIVERIENQPTDLGDYEEVLKRDRKEFRRNFLFRNDEP
jgi:metal-responsive CopG/Arc/MetJ family transcriptional regulator